MSSLEPKLASLLIFKFMLYYLIPLIIIIACLAVIIYTIIKNFPRLAAINVESIAQEKESKVRNRIMTERLSRRFLSLKRVFNDFFQPLISDLFKAGQDFYQKITDLEKMSLKAQPLNQIDVAQQVKDKIEETKKFLAEQNFEKAEEVAISIIKLDGKNLDVYEFLTEVYLARKDYKKARETCRYLLKLLTKGKVIGDNSVEKHRLANCYAELGSIYQLQHKNTYSLANYQKAVELEPSNPRFLDLLLKISIILRNKTLASQVFSDLKAADPDNQKLPELQQQIDNLPDQVESVQK